MRSATPIVHVDVPPQPRSLPEKALLWATAHGYGNCANGDATRFPEALAAIKARQNAFKNDRGAAFRSLATFTDAARNSLDRIWVLDPYLLKPEAGGDWRQNIEAIMKWIPKETATRCVRLLTSSQGGVVERDMASQFSEQKKKINNHRRYQVPITIEVKYTLNRSFPYVHDRFAIVDDELWHFGATVGGLHPDVSAASRGWSAREHRAVEFFEMAWQGDRDLMGKGK